MKETDNEANSWMLKLSRKDSAKLNTLKPVDDVPFRLLQQLKDGDAKAYENIYVHWRKPIYNFLVKLIGSESDADDITQDIFVWLWESRSYIDPNKNFRAFLYLITRRMAIKHFMKRKVRNDYASSGDFNCIDNYTSEDIVIEKELELLKDIVIHNMQPQRRKIFEMSHNQGMSDTAIAKELNLSVQTVYNQLSRARKEIKELLAMICLFIGMP